MKVLWKALCFSFLLSSLLSAGVYNIRLITDNVPDFTDIDSLVRSEAALWKTPQEKAIAIWRWARRSRRQTSCAVDGGRLIWDPVLHYNSYGAMNCGVVSALNIACWLRLGYKARYIQLGDHTVSEVSWDGGAHWHLFDSSMSIFCFNHEGGVASCEEIKEAHACPLSGGKKEPGHFYYYHYWPPCATHSGPTGWRCAADNPVGYERTLFNGASSYTSGYTVSRYCQYGRFGRRYILNLRPYEAYTRYWKPLDDLRNDGDPSTNDPDFFRPLPNGSDPDDQHGLNDLRGNGVWRFEPDLASPLCADLLFDSEGIRVGPTEGLRPALRPEKAGREGWAVFSVSAANVITSMRIAGIAYRASPEDRIEVAVSRDTGITWTRVGEIRERGRKPFRFRLRESVAGHTECLVRITCRAARDPADCGLFSLRITTITQLNRRALPKLTRGVNRILFEAGEPLQTLVLWPVLHGGAFKKTAFAFSGIYSDKKPDGIYKATIGAAENGKPCFVTWRVRAPGDIAGVTYGVVVTNRSPNHYVSLLHSWDGENFKEFFRKDDGDAPFDVQVVHTVKGKDVPAGARTAFIKCVFFCKDSAGTYGMPGIQDLFVRVRYRPRHAEFKPVDITYRWIEHRKTGDVERSHTECAASPRVFYRINVGGFRDPTMRSVRLNLRGYAPAGEQVRYGYGDGEDVGEAAERPKVRYVWGRNLARGKKYRVSRTSSDSSRNPDSDGRELTNGVVIAPTDRTRSKAVQAAGAFWDRGEPVTVTVDLERSFAVAGVRVTTHQPNRNYAHPERIEVDLSSDGKKWSEGGVIRHDDLWNPPGDYEPWEHDDDPDYERLPAGGRLAYSFPLVFKRPVPGRYVRFTFVPLRGRGMGISEIQVFEKATTEGWPGEVAFPVSEPDAETER